MSLQKQTKAQLLKWLLADQVSGQVSRSCDLVTGLGRCYQNNTELIVPGLC